MAIVVNVIGPGRVGQTMLGLLHRAGYAIGDVAGRNVARTETVVARLGAGRAVRLEDMAPADLWCLAVPDDQITAAAEALALVAEPSVAVHFSGFHSADNLEPLRANGWSVAGLHPVMSFADPERVVETFDGTYCGIEGDAAALVVLEEMIARIGGKAFPIRSESKALYHGAAVVANNFTTVLQGLAHELWSEAGVPEDISRALCQDLVEGSARNVAGSNAQDALTGPAARGDKAVLDAQQKAFAAWNAEAGALYGTMTDLAQRLKAQGQVMSKGTPEPEDADHDQADGPNDL
ncbi:MAG: DUF2520 domain-containing protein [Marinovum sp.]|nr:DUF2520 domain-containing protein [Marinovum sp.]